MSPRAGGLLPTSLSGRLIATVVAFVAVVSVLIAVATTVVLRAYLLDRLDTDVAESLQRAQTAVRTEQRGPDATGPDGPGPPAPLGNRTGSITALITEGGDVRTTRVTSTGDPVALGPGAERSLADVTPGAEARTIDVAGLGPFRVAAATTPGGDVVVQGLPTTDVDDTVGTVVLWEAVLAALGITAAAVAGRSLVRRQLQPLRDVANAAHEVTTMDLASGAVGRTVRVPDTLVDSATEVGQVGEALNRLLGHVEEALGARHASEQQARQFLADASHELRTPLSTIRGYAELVRRVQMTDPDELATVLAKVESEAGRMSRLVEDMFVLARLDAGRGLQLGTVDLARLVADAVQDAEVVDPDRTWECDLPDRPVEVSGDEQRLHQLVTNLLRNGTAHTRVGTTVRAVLRSDGDTVELTIADDGPGIEADLLPTLFDRFTRGDSSRTRASGGAGLGTSLVQAIAAAHGGSVSVTSEPGATRFLVQMPRSTAPIAG